jgi:FtsH-binding integral membrane protein
MAAEAPAEARASFIRRTYGHLAGAVLAFIVIEYLLLHIPGVGETALAMMFSSQLSWLVVLLAFMGVSYLANMWANSDTSPGLQYLGLSLYVVAEAVIFLPLLFYAEHNFPNAITSAGIMTFAVFCGLTLAVFLTRRDFSHMAPILTIGSFLALGAIIALMIFPNQIGFIIFCFFMVALASGYIIYQTSNVMLHYRTDQHVAAALALFASVMLLFWYILQLVMSRDR